QHPTLSAQIGDLGGQARQHPASSAQIEGLGGQARQHPASSAQIEGLGGQARQEGKVYFVYGALPEEKVKARVVQEQKNFARAETLEILTTSKQRVKPPCPYYGRCGGCQLQHLDYEEQLVWKRKWLQELLSRIGSLADAQVEAVVPSPKPYGYRNRVSLTLFHKTGGRVRQGFLSRDSERERNTDSRHLVDITSCDISMPQVAQAIKEMALKNNQGDLFGDFQGKLRLEIATDGQNTFFLPWQTPEEKSGGPGAKPEEGKILREKVLGMEFEFSPQVFFQVNSYLLPSLVQAVAEMIPAEDAENTCLFDLYSGVGLFGISLAGRVKKVISLEESKLAWQFALRNMKRNNIANMFAYSGRVEAKFQKFFDRHQMAKNILLVDPPRGGLETKMIDLLRAAREKIHSLIYLSCEPSILARDIARLKTAGFGPKRLAPFDLFPQTQVFETIALLRPA
ncbi:MAG: class I SAM-dependent RNA methyltransferase, partial [Candidatus Omnitrophica bacterium]|nr:class I SAM-dependent RNA methyltransferase [Candidatus Omnitrophota bacterium]